MIPVRIPQVLRFRGQNGRSWWLRGQDPGWGTSSLLPCGQKPGGIPQVCGFVVRMPVGIPQVCGFAVKMGTSSFVADPQSGYLQFGGFVGRIPVGIPQVCGQDPGWDASSNLVFVPGFQL